jgi:hypothetical protein
MKKQILTLVVIFLAIFATANFSQAGVTVHFKLNVTDNCTPSGYQGSYCVNIYIQINNVTYCTHRSCQIGAGNNDIQYNCDLPYSEDVCNYVLHVEICRYTDPLTCCTSQDYPNQCFDYLLDGNHTYYITL